MKSSASSSFVCTSNHRAWKNPRNTHVHAVRDKNVGEIGCSGLEKRMVGGGSVSIVDPQVDGL